MLSAYRNCLYEISMGCPHDKAKRFDLKAAIRNCVELSTGYQLLLQRKNNNNATHFCFHESTIIT